MVIARIAIRPGRYKMDMPTKTNGHSEFTPERIFRDYGPRVYNLARRMLGNDTDAEDVTQEVLLQVVRKLDTFRGDADIMTWLHRVTVNAALAHRRKRAKREEREVHDPLQQFLDDGHHGRSVNRWDSPPEQQVLDKETSELIDKAITALPEIYRDVYILADVEQLPNAEIAEMLDLSLPAVKSRLHRGRLMMRDALAPHFEEVTS